MQQIYLIKKMKKNLKVTNKLFNNYLNIDDISSSIPKDKSNSLIKPKNLTNANISIMNNESNKNNSSNQPYNDLYQAQEEQNNFNSTNVYTKSKEEKSQSN